MRNEEQEIAIDSYRRKLANAIKIMAAHGIDLDLYSKAIQDDLMADCVLFSVKHEQIHAMNPVDMSRAIYNHSDTVYQFCVTKFKKSDELPPEVAFMALREIESAEHRRNKVRTDAVQSMRDVVEKNPNIKLLFV